MSLYLFLDKIKEIYNKDASLFFMHLKKIFICLGRNLGAQDDYLEVLYIDSARAKT